MTNSNHLTTISIVSTHSDVVIYEISSGIATIILNRPENKNALSVEMVNAIGDCFDRAQNDPNARVILFTNSGNTFCAGADLKAAAPGVVQPEARHTFTKILDDIMESPKPVIGSIAGHCTGGGVGLAAAFDISVAADDIIFGFTEVRIGVAPAVISVVCLPKLRRADASELFLSGEKIPAERAAYIGLINQSVPRSQLDIVVSETIDKVVKGGPNALAASKQLVSKVPQMQRSEAWDWTSHLSQSLFKSEEAQEGIGAFKERRHPNWVPK